MYPHTTHTPTPITHVHTHTHTLHTCTPHTHTRREGRKLRSFSQNMHLACESPWLQCLTLKKERKPWEKKHKQEQEPMYSALTVMEAQAPGTAWARQTVSHPHASCEEKWSHGTQEVRAGCPRIASPSNLASASCVPTLQMPCCVSALQHWAPSF